MRVGGKDLLLQRCQRGLTGVESGLTHSVPSIVGDCSPLWAIFTVTAIGPTQSSIESPSRISRLIVKKIVIEE